MNKTLEVNQIVSGPGILSTTNDQVMSGTYVNGEYYDIHSKQTMLQLDPHAVQQIFDQHMIVSGAKILEDHLLKFLADKVRFEVISWTNEQGEPEVTCQMWFDKKLLVEKTATKVMEEVPNVNV